MGREEGGGATAGRPADTIIRAPNHLGDVVMALPALEAVADADVLVPRPLVEIVGMSRFSGRVVPFDRGARGFARAVAALRRRRYRRAILLPNSFSSALMARLGGARVRRGVAADGRSPLLTDRIAADRLDGLHQTSRYLLIATGERLETPPPSRLVPTPEARERWRRLVGRLDGPVLGILQGGSAPGRRWDADRFRAVAERLLADGVRVVVFGGPEETARTAEVAVPGSIDVGGRTDLPMLAAGLAACDAVVGNDCGPNHVAQAVGTPAVVLCGAGDPAIIGPRGPEHVVLRRAELPCVPCIKNECPRTGAGYVLPNAERECLRLITVDEVVAMAKQLLAGERAGRR